MKFLLFGFVQCSRQFFSGKVDVVHVHNMPDFLVFAGLMPRIFGKKIILDIHDSMPESFTAKFRKESRLFWKLMCWEEAVSSALAHRVICVNHVQQKIIAERGIPENKIVVSMNVPDHHLFKLTPHNERAISKNHQFRMIYHGTVAERLGVDLVVEAVARLADRIPGLEFHLWSKSGDELDAIDALSRKLEVSNRVHILRGGVPLDELPGKLRDMDLGVIGNRKEKATQLMLPVKMLEYIALGIPVVAPRLECIEYYFSKDMVSYFEPGNVDSMASAILELYKDRERRAKQAKTAEGFLHRYGWENHQYDLLDMYHDILKTKGNYGNHQVRSARMR